MQREAVLLHFFEHIEAHQKDHPNCAASLAKNVIRKIPKDKIRQACDYIRDIDAVYRAKAPGASPEAITVISSLQHNRSERPYLSVTVTADERPAGSSPCPPSYLVSAVTPVGRIPLGRHLASDVVDITKLLDSYRRDIKKILKGDGIEDRPLPRLSPLAWSALFYLAHQPKGPATK
jgi:hypothetical protein